MSVSEMRARVKASIWQAVAQSGVDVSVLSAGAMDKLVEAITDRVLKDANDMMGKAAGSLPPVSAEDDERPEKVLWEGQPYLSMTVRYQITNERVRIVEGLFGKERRDIELIRIQDIDHKQNPAERTLNMGDVYIRSHDVTDPEEVHEILRRAVLEARKNHNMSFREEM